LGLTVRQSRKTTTKASARAAELAAKVIDSREDSEASPVERDDRKRRLLKGPSAFREMRKDRQK
jgi:predicted nucleic acid-binding Zn ribbon protein